jgi:hypothetical protein
MVDAFVPATERQQVVMDSTFTRLNVSAMAPSYTTSTGFLSFTAFSTDEKGRCLSFHSFSLPVPPLAHLCSCKAVPIIVLERSTALLYDCLQPALSRASMVVTLQHDKLQRGQCQTYSLSLSLSLAGSILKSKTQNIRVRVWRSSPSSNSNRSY